MFFTSFPLVVRKTGIIVERSEGPKSGADPPGENAVTKSQTILMTHNQSINQSINHSINHSIVQSLNQNQSAMEMSARNMENSHSAFM